MVKLWFHCVIQKDARNCLDRIFQKLLLICSCCSIYRFVPVEVDFSVKTQTILYLSSFIFFQALCCIIWNKAPVMCELAQKTELAFSKSLHLTFGVTELPKPRLVTVSQRQGTPMTGHQSVTGPHKHKHTHIHTWGLLRTINLEGHGGFKPGAMSYLVMS